MESVIVQASLESNELTVNIWENYLNRYVND
jgi:hypothetical protein